LVEFQPYECDIAPFDGKEFWKRLGNRTLLFVGDSMQAQAFLNLRCELERAGLADEANRVVFGSSKHRFENSIGTVEQSSMYRAAASVANKTEQLAARVFAKAKQGVAARLASNAGRLVGDDAMGELDLFVTPTLFERSAQQASEIQHEDLDYFDTSKVAWLPKTADARRRTVRGSGVVFCFLF
jgi:hypothetical protein